jgi:hypothetical protein
MGNNVILRIHGDNIIECERALFLIASVYEAKIVKKSKCLYLPSYELLQSQNKLFEIELFAGHDRWNVSIAKVLATYGSPLREATDAYITKLSEDAKTEQILIAIEFCNALPAGNNAWQRSGRAITSAEIGMPYFYYAEVGGVELDSNRKVKAPRFPNPIVPFSYLTASISMKVICIPIYEAHPAITDELRKKFTQVFGLDDSLKLIKCILTETDTQTPLNSLIEKGTMLVKILSNDRKKVDTLKNTEWDDFLKISSGLQKAKWLVQNAKDLIWKKKQSEKVNVSNTFKKLLAQIQKLNCLSVGAKEIPICLVPDAKILDLANIFKFIYPKQTKLYNTISELNKSLIIVWITGFKPRGDDSRPDRGLVPLARMLFGNDIDILTIVFGPAKTATWKQFEKNPKKLAEINGLWEAVLNLSNFVFTDSATSEKGEMFYTVQRKLDRQCKSIIFNQAEPTNTFSEQDVDTAIHTIFSKQEKFGIYESMCNPPGGDWSGVSILDFNKLDEYRWTSLPRVSAVQGKRPDHIIQLLYQNELTFLSIESKDDAGDLDTNIGERLNTYLKELFASPPTAYKLKGKDWQLYTQKKTPVVKFKTFSGGAFCFKNDDEIASAVQAKNLDFVFAFEFKPVDQTSILHFRATDQCKFLIDLLTKLTEQFGSGIKIQVH